MLPFGLIHTQYCAKGRQVFESLVILRKDDTSGVEEHRNSSVASTEKAKEHEEECNQAYQEDRLLCRLGTLDCRNSSSDTYRTCCLPLRQGMSAVGDATANHAIATGCYGTSPKLRRCST